MKNLFRNASLMAMAVLAGNMQLSAQNTIAPTYKFIKKINLTGNGKWDFLKMDGEKERLYVSHFDKVHVIDLNTDKQIAEITGLNGVHGIGLAKEISKGYITNGGNNTVTVFEDKTFKVLKTINVKGKKPDAIIHDKASNKVFAFCGKSNNVVVIDPANDEEVASIELGGKPEIAVADGKGLIFNNIEDKNEVVVIDSKNLKVNKHYSLGDNKAPTGIALDTKNNRLFVTCEESKTLVIMNAENGKIITVLPIGENVDGVIYEKELGLIITSNGDGTATIVKQISADSYKLAQTLKTNKGCKTIVHRGTTHNIFLSGAEFSEKEIKPDTFGVYIYGPGK